MKEIPNTNFLVSVQHFWIKSANLEIFDVSRKGQVQKIYSLEEVSGGAIDFTFNMKRDILFLSLVTGPGDVSYNLRRDLLGAISLERKIAYHLFGIDHAGQKYNSGAKLLKKAKWHSQYDTDNRNQSNLLVISQTIRLENCITGWRVCSYY